MKRLFLGIALVLGSFSLLLQCDVSDDIPVVQTEIPVSAETVSFAGVDWSNVSFSHAEHSERYNNLCIKCHDHETVAGQTHWYCRSCHTVGEDSEALCDPVENHGCIMTQCNDCHEIDGENPGLTCMECHTGGANLIPGSQPEGEPILVLTDAVSLASEVDHWVLNFETSGHIIIDVEAFEACIGNPKGIPTDFFDDGEANNKLVANMYLFTEGGTLVGSATGSYPGDTAPGAHDTRTGQSPYLAMDIDSGTYVLAIGSYPLSQADAWAELNTDGSNWSDYDDFNDITLYNRYNIKIYFEL